MKFNKKNTFFIAFFVVFFLGFFKSQSQLDFYITDGQGSQIPVVNCNYPFVNGNCVSLTANYPQYKLTDKYNVSATVYRPYLTTNKTVIKGNLDDIFTKAIDLPFTFCFYNEAYKKIVIGSNGMISFDAAQANQPNAPNFIDTLPNTTMPKRSIFGVLHDMYFSTSDDSEISYSVIGTAPFRKFVVNFYKGRVYGCDNITSTSQIVLSEGSNTIEVFVENKDLPCGLANFKNSLIGINDATGTKGIAAPGRNTGIWSAQNEAWVFSPDGGNITPSFVWHDSSGTVIGNQKVQVVCPQKETKYSVDIIYSLCNGETNTYKDDINIKFASDFPSVKPYDKYICSNSELITLADFKNELCTNSNISDFNFEFKDTSTGLQVDENTPFSINGNKTYSVTVSNKISPNCKAITTLGLKLVFGTINVNTVYLCDMLNDEVEASYDLTKFNSQIVGNNFQGSIGYYLSKNDALNNIGQVSTFDIKKDTEIYVRLTLQNCVNILGPIAIGFNRTPVVNTPVKIDLELCDINSDGFEIVDWSTLIESQITSDPTVTSIRVFNTYNEAFTALPSNSAINTVKEGTYKLYVRLDNAGGCFSIAEIDLKIVFKTIVLKDYVAPPICFDGTQDIQINLNTITAGMLVSPLNGTVTGPIFFASYQDAVSNDPTKVISANQTITNNGIYVSKVYYARYETGPNCYTIKLLNVNLFHLVKDNDQFNICDNGNDGTENVKLTSYSSQIVQNSGAKILFFATNQDAVNNLPSTNINTTNVNGTTTVYARVELYSCIEIYPITFTLVNTPNINRDVVITIKNICDNNADGKESIDLKTFEHQINVNNENVSFTYYQSYNPATDVFSNQYTDPRNVNLSNGTVVYVKVKYATSACYSVSKLTFNLEFYPSIYLDKTAVLKLCDKELNFGESFDLTSAISQIFDQNINPILLQDLKITYYANEVDANNGIPSTQITSPYIILAGNIFVYARFESKINGCYSVAPINLLSYFPVKSKNSIIKICDNNLDGYYDVNLLAYKDQMVQIPNPENRFTFYINQADIDVPGKEIQNPENFILNPYVSKIWVKVENLKDCGTFAEIDFVNGARLALTPSQFNITQCDEGNDGKETLNLTAFETNFGASYTYEYFETLQDMNDYKNQIQNPGSYNFDVAKGISKFYVKVSKPGFCPDFYTIDITLNKTPMINIADYYYCKNDNIGLDIKPNFTGLNVVYYKWEYPDGTIKEGANQDFLTGVKTIGTYKLTLTNSMSCTYTAVFKVINIDTPEIISLKGENDFYVVEATGLPGRKIVYSMDLIHWQDSNIFGNLKVGDYSFFVKYEDSNCYGDVRRGKIYTVLNSFTPNGDGVNDYWKLTGLDVFSDNSTLRIFDKYGNQVYQQTSNTEFVWDGKMNNRNLPTDAYWYVIIAADGRTYRGWILLKNRN